MYRCSKSAKTYSEVSSGILVYACWVCRIKCVFVVFVKVKTDFNWSIALKWRHNERDGVSNHQHHVCLLKRLFRRRSKKTPKLRVASLCEGDSMVTGEFPSQRASNAKNVSIWWRHHAKFGDWEDTPVTYFTLLLSSNRKYVYMEPREPGSGVPLTVNSLMCSSTHWKLFGYILSSVCLICDLLCLSFCNIWSQELATYWCFAYLVDLMLSADPFLLWGNICTLCYNHQQPQIGSTKQ